MKPLVLVSVTLGALALASCAARRPITTPPAGDGPTWSLPAVVPLQDPATDAPISRGPAADGVTTAPLGVGLMFSPNNVLFGGAIDIPLDERLTVGPAVQVGVGDDFMIAPFGQAKYFLPIEDDNGDQSPLLPFVSAGAGFAYIDRDGRKDDSGLMLNVGGGIRYRTGRAYRIGSQVLANFAPDEIAGDRVWLTWEILQVVVDF